MSDWKNPEACSVAELMQREHNRIDRGLELLMTCRSHVSRDGYRVLSILQDHMALEESRIFPIFEEAGYAAPVRFMLLEHEKIRRHIEKITASLASSDVTAIEDEIRLLVMQLGEHNGKEEAIFYDRLESILDENSQLHLLHNLVRKGQQWE